MAQSWLYSGIAEIPQIMYYNGITSLAYHDFVLCNKAVVHSWGWCRKKLFYRLKNALLNKYAVFTGYQLQVWEDECVFSGPAWVDQHGVEHRETFAEHKHILSCHSMNGGTFHMPTDEFCYWNQNGVHKQSQNFDTFLKLCVPPVIEGKKRDQPCEHIFDRERDYAFRRLVMEHGHLLREHFA